MSKFSRALSAGMGFLGGLRKHINFPRTLLFLIFLFASAGMGFARLAFVPVLVCCFILAYTRMSFATHLVPGNMNFFALFIDLSLLVAVLDMSLAFSLYENPIQSGSPIQGSDYYSTLAASVLPEIFWNYFKPNKHFSDVFIFPILWTLMWRVLAMEGLPMGSWGNWGQMLFTGDGSVGGWIESASLVGPSSADFCLAVFAQSMCDLLLFDSIKQKFIGLKSYLSNSTSNEREPLIQFEQGPLIDIHSNFDANETLEVINSDLNQVRTHENIDEEAKIIGSYTFQIPLQFI
ncbi:hypothetical protein HK096_005771 [Nowakowskiella sp. JEL0078]|nr:hypothetical protein HK096_005771 [Nowakowskiella sp. JEL0078]